MLITYGSCIRGDIFSIVSKKLTSPQKIEGRWGWLFTLSIRNKTQSITATAAKIAVDMTATKRPKVVSITNTAKNLNEANYSQKTRLLQAHRTSQLR